MVDAAPPNLLDASAHQSSSLTSSSLTPRRPANAASLFAALPLIFEPNQGQANLDASDPRARFVAHGSGYALALGSEGAILSLRSGPATSAAVRMRFAGSNPKALLSGESLLPGKSNYLIGGDSAKWRTNIPQFARVRYQDVYPGINLVFYGKQGHLEYDFEVAPGADPAQAELEFDGAKATAQSDGSLLIERKGAAMRLQTPRVYQKIAGREQPVEGRFVLRNSHRAGFVIGSYDHSRELVIDPVLTFSSYFGGTGDEHATSVVVDASGNIYLAGSTNSPNLGTPGVFQPALNPAAGARNVYIAKIDPATNPVSLVYVTYVGGSGVDTPAGIAVDGAGDPFIAGTTSSADFPHTATAYQTAPETGSTGTKHVFVTELDATASVLQYSSYLSGSGDDLATGMTIDSAGNLYVTGSTTSTLPSDVGSPTGPQFPSSSLPYAIPFQSTALATIQFFVTKVNTTNSGKASIAYSTYFGGANTANGVAPIVTGGGIAVDANGNMYFDGTTNFTFTNGALGDFPILDAYQPCLNQPPPVPPINPPVCTNSTTSTETDAFAAKINPIVGQGEQLQWSTYFGGVATDSATGIAVDVGATSVFLTGTTNSPNISGTTNFAPFQVCLDTPQNPATGTPCPTIGSPAPTDAYVARLSNPTSSGTTITNIVLNYFSYLGGAGNEQGLAITVDTTDNAYLTGWTQSGGGLATNFPVFPPPGDLQSSLAGTQDAFIARLNTNTINGQNTSGAFSSYFGGANTISAPNAFTQGTGIALDASQDVYFAGDTNSIDLLTNALQTHNAGGFDAFVTELGSVTTISVSGVLTLGTNQTFIPAGTPATFTYTVTNNGPDPANNLGFSDVLSGSPVPLTFVSANSTSGTCGGGGTATNVTCNIPTLQVGSIATVTVVVTPTATGNQERFNGGSVTVSGPGVTNPQPIQVPAQMSDFSLLVTPPNNSVDIAGHSATYQVKLTPNPVYGTNVALSCSGNIPNGAACTFSPGTSITLPGTSPGAATLTITTTARPITAARSGSGLRSYWALWLFAPGLSLLGMGVGTSRRRRRIFGLLSLCLLFTLLLLLPACSGTSTQAPVSGTPAGTYNIVVSATSGTDTKSQGIQLTVP